MILRFAARRSGLASTENKSPAAAHVFLESQKRPDGSCGFVTQVAHSHVAGQLARALVADAFGELPPEVAEAAADHDLGWADSDKRQIATLPDPPPKPFPAMRQDELASWRRSLELADSGSPLARCLISRHFSALAEQPSLRHEIFLVTETGLRTEIERLRGFRENDLQQWAGAVGFCDLLSLYLCSGLQHTVSFPLTHPAYEDADRAPHVMLQWDGGMPVLSQRLFQPGTTLEIEVSAFEDGACVHQDIQSITLR